MGYEVILETRDGWRRVMSVPEDVPFVDIPQAVQQLDLAAGAYSPVSGAHFIRRRFQWDGNAIEMLKEPDGTVSAMEIWKER